MPPAGPSFATCCQICSLGRRRTRFAFRDKTFSEANELVWLLVDGDGTQTGDVGGTETFAYRLKGFLQTKVHSGAGCRLP
jgi:hypothetical protein